MMRKIAILILALFLITDDAYARGSFSSGGGRGGYSSSRSYSAPSRSYSSPSRATTAPGPSRSTTTRTTTTTRSSVGGGMYSGGGGYYHPMMYPGFGMGYGYSNGILTGLIIGNMMHPQGTTVYTGGGYSGNALLYPDGRVVNSDGYQVGNYQNGQFAAQQGGMVAQPAPPQQAAQPVVIESGYSGWQIFTGIVVTVLVVVILIVIFL